jgi:hypothetical protein
MMPLTVAITIAAMSFLGMLFIASARYWIKFVDAA